MVVCNGHDKGLILEKYSKKVELDWTGAQSASDRPKSKLAAGPHAEPPPAKWLGLPEDARTRALMEEESWSDKLQDSEEYLFQILRGNEPSKKPGAKAKEKTLTDNFEIEEGHIFLSSNSEMDGDMVVTNRDGVSGKASPDVVEHFEGAWQFPETMRLTGEMPNF